MTEFTLTNILQTHDHMIDQPPKQVTKPIKTFSRSDHKKKVLGDMICNLEKNVPSKPLQDLAVAASHRKSYKSLEA